MAQRRFDPFVLAHFDSALVREIGGVSEWRLSEHSF